MTLSSWFCPNNRKNMFVKIVHPGGHAELHDRPVAAAEVMQRNPRCCVAYPNVFQEPSAVVSPGTMLMLGQKYYVVPMSTVRKLQRLFPPNNSGDDDDNNNNANASPKPLDAGVKVRRDEKEREMGCLGEGNCFMCWFTRIKVNNNDDDSCPEVIIPAKMESSVVSSRKEEVTRKRAMKSTGNEIRGSPKKRMSFDYWQPSLESIEEE